MRAKCPKCGAVFEVKVGLSLVHFGPYRSTKCPACGKRSITNNFVSDLITWPPDSAGKSNSPPPSEEELREKRLDESKFESPEE
jgi:predicted RNA-binding Zn-ribbon protein involved in translation (DUF1610 family)